MRIATKLGLSTALIAIVTSILLGGFIYHNLKEQLYQSESKGQLTLAHSIMSKIDHLLYIAQRDMHILVEDEFLQSYVGSPSSRTPQSLKQLEDELSERLELTGPWDTLMVLDEQGNHLINTNAHSGHGNIRQYPDSYTAYKAALKGHFYNSDVISQTISIAPLLSLQRPFTNIVNLPVKLKKIILSLRAPLSRTFNGPKLKN